MQRKTATRSIVPISAVVVSVMALGLAAAFANNGEAQSVVAGKVHTAQAQSESPAGGANKAKTTLLLEQNLEGIPGFKMQIVLVEAPPGWVGGRHYHPGHLFGYILEGSSNFNFENMTARTVKSGEAFYEAPNTVVRGRNGSNDDWLRSLIFQVLPIDQSPAISVD